jgi:2-iminobutanoate/2-iminopropanoate deaminase
MRVRCEGIGPLRRGDVAENLGANGVQRYDPFDGGLGLSLATRVGSLVFTSGMVGFDGATGSVPSDLEEEIRLAFTNLGNVLSEMGTSFEYVVEQTNFLVGDPGVVYPVFQKVRAETFAGHFPASTSVFVQALVGPDCHCEVKLVATIPE